MANFASNYDDLLNISSIAPKVTNFADYKDVLDKIKDGTIATLGVAGASTLAYLGSIGFTASATEAGASVASLGAIDSIVGIGGAAATVGSAATAAAAGAVGTLSVLAAAGVIGSAIGVAIGNEVWKTNKKFCIQFTNALTGSNIPLDAEEETVRAAMDNPIPLFLRDNVSMLSNEYMELGKDVFLDNARTGGSEFVITADTATVYGNSYVQFPLRNKSTGLIEGYGRIGWSAPSPYNYQYVACAITVVSGIITGFYFADRDKDVTASSFGNITYEYFLNDGSKIGSYTNYWQSNTSNLSPEFVLSPTGAAANYEMLREGITFKTNYPVFTNSADATGYVGTGTATNAINTPGFAVAGFTEIPNSVHPTKGKTLAETYPAWAGASTKKAVKVNPKTGELTDSKLWPVTIPNAIPGTAIPSVTQAEAQAGRVLPTTEPLAREQVSAGIKPLVKGLEKAGTYIPDGPDNSEIGVTPPLPTPTSVTYSGMITMYNPSIVQVKSFSEWLWTDSIVEQLRKKFYNPMDAIIGFYALYAQPEVGPSMVNMKIGYIESTVKSNIVTNQFTNIDCGTITVPEFFNSALDYAPYTKCSLYLPFIGIVQLNTDDIMNSQLNVSYKIDVLTGTCVAFVKVIRNSLSAILYQFSGNCAVQLPITSGSMIGIYSAVVGAAINIGASVATGGNIASSLITGASQVINSKAEVRKSGNLGSNAGALSPRRPYLIIARPDNYSANGYNEYYGYPSNQTVQLSSCSGYTRVKDIFTDIAVATEEEKSMIKNALKEGVIL